MGLNGVVTASCLVTVLGYRGSRRARVAPFKRKPARCPNQEQRLPERRQSVPA